MAATFSGLGSEWEVESMVGEVMETCQVLADNDFLAEDNTED